MIKVLVVEDEGIVALDIKRYLELSGYEVAGVFSSGEEALDKLDELSPDLVLMDIKLQGEIDGLETAEIIKKSHNIPVILLTAYADEKTVDRAKTIEPFGYIIKPFEERELRTTIEMALYRSSLERKLHESEERYRNFFQNDLSADFVARQDGTLVACNKAFARLFLFPTIEDAAQSNWNDRFPDMESGIDFWNLVKKKRSLELYEFDFIRNDKKPVFVLANIVGVFEEDDGRLKECLGYLIDISKRRELEYQLRQSQKMEAIGRLAGGVAHDFNNILTVIMGYSSIITEKLNDGEELGGELDGILTASRKATLLTRQLLAFSRRQILKPEKIDLNTLIYNLEKLIRRLISEDISVVYLPQSDGSLVFVDPGQMEQVLINLVVNARDAMPGGGKLIIQTGVVEINKSISSQMGEIPFGKYVRLTISDTGTGIQKDTINLIFEPFFTTKPDEKGTGLGLATVYGIVKQSNGYIQVETDLGKGTAFYIYMSAIQSDLKAVSDEEMNDHEYSGDESVLLVEDEDAVRTLLSKILSRSGYRVMEAKNAGEAVLISEKYIDQIDIVVSDLIMPHMNGKQLGERLRKMRPDLKILFISGYPDVVLKGYGLKKEAENFLSKPFEPFDLVRRIRKIIDNGN